MQLSFPLTLMQLKVGCQQQTSYADATISRFSVIRFLTIYIEHRTEPIGFCRQGTDFNSSSSIIVGLVRFVWFSSVLFGFVHP